MSEATRNSPSPSDPRLPRAVAHGLVPIILATLAASAVHAQDLASARNFLVRLYAHYPTSDRSPSFDALGKAEPSIFDAAMIHLIAEDTRLAHGDIPTLDGDPVCDCQDDGGMTFKVQDVRAAAPNAATATVLRRGPDNEKPETINLDLVHTAKGWRIHDVRTVDTPSLRDLLIKSNAEAAKRRKSPG